MFGGWVNDQKFLLTLSAQRTKNINVPNNSTTEDFPSQHDPHLLSLSSQLLRDRLVQGSKSPGSSFNFHFNGTIVLFLVETFLPWEPRPLNQQSPKLWGQEAKNKTKYKKKLLMYFRGNFERVFLPLHSWSWEKQHQILVANSKHMLILENINTTLQNAITQMALYQSSKGHPAVQSGQMLQDNGGYGETNEFHEDELNARFNLL